MRRALTTLVGTLVLLVAMGLEACTVRQHALAAAPTASLLDQAATLIEQHARDQLAELEQRYPAGTARDQAVAVLRSSYAPIESAYALALAAQRAYVAAIRDAEDGGPPVGTGVALHLAQAWEQLLRAASGLGLDLPAPPDALARAAGGES